ncbi:MAG: hypothetical protein KJZ69_06900 [Phycisphaerales bacterium]|nr:hypothetical protein [Phycisphaerales bacterium]
MDGLTRYLFSHDFRSLFVEELGWDRCNGQIRIEIDGAAIDLSAVAEKRGLRVVHCAADRYTLLDRKRLRQIQKRLAKVAHEHIVIYTCEAPKKQVWQWAIVRPDGHTLLHREHPFFSERPPAPLVARLHGLRFALDEEDRITLVDALQRVRGVLDTKAEQNLFVDKPWYARMSDELACRMRDGGTAEYHEFVLFHERLARWATGGLARILGIEIEDAVQVGMICLLRTAKRFRPELGYQFSTYATTSIHRECHRLGSRIAFLISIPSHRFWPMNRVRRGMLRLDSRRGEGRGRDILEWAMLRDRRFASDWLDFDRAMNIRSLSDRREYDLACRIASTEPDPAYQSRLDKALEHLPECLAALPPADAEVIRCRYGIGCDPETLEQIGRRLGVTKERIRQRQLKIEYALRASLLDVLGELPEPVSPVAVVVQPDGIAPDGSTAGAGQQSDRETSSDDGSHLNGVALRPQHQMVQGDLFTHAR